MSEEVFKGRIFTVTRDAIVLPTGKKAVRDIVRHPGSAIIVPLLPDGRVLLVRQYRFATGQNIWEIPAGTLGENESPENCALREVEEETGYKASSVEFVATMWPSPGYCDELMHLFVARGLTRSEQNLDEDEIMEAHSFDTEQLRDMIRNNEIRDAKTLAGLFLVMGEKLAP